MNAENMSTWNIVKDAQIAVINVLMPAASIHHPYLKLRHK
jgi:hypothetical protein